MERNSLNFDWVPLPNITDNRGILTYIEEYDIVPFSIHHVSYFLGNENFQSNIAYYTNIKHLALIGIEGKATLGDESIQISSGQSKILLIGEKHLKGISFSDNFVGLILASSSNQQKIGDFNKESKLGELHSINSSLFPPEESPFKIPRIFFITDVVNGSIRGQHAHKTCDQVLIMLKGTCEVSLEKNGIKKELKLCDSLQLIHLPSRTWLELRDFDKNSILLVLSSEEFIEGNYIRDYKTYKEYYSVI